MCIKLNSCGLPKTKLFYYIVISIYYDLFQSANKAESKQYLSCKRLFSVNKAENKQYLSTQRFPAYSNLLRELTVQNNPPTVNKAINPKAKIIGVVNLKLPPYNVANQLKILIPVGTAIIIVAAVK